MQTQRPTAEEMTARLAAARREAEAAMRSTRAKLLEQIRAKGIEIIEAEYDGYGDSGNVNEITAGMGHELENAVICFVWDFAYDRHPGFENNEGGQGTLTWDIVADSITLSHGNNFVEIDHSYEEGL